MAQINGYNLQLLIYYYNLLLKIMRWVVCVCAYVRLRVCMREWQILFRPLIYEMYGRVVYEKSFIPTRMEACNKSHKDAKVI